VGTVIECPDFSGRLDPAPAPSSRSRWPNAIAFSNVNSSPGSIPRAGLRLPRSLPIRLGGTGAGMSSFMFTAIAGGRECSRPRGGGAGTGGGWDDGSLLGAGDIFEQEDREEREEVVEEEVLERRERVETVFERGDVAELGSGPSEVAGGKAEEEGAKGYSYGLDRSKRYGVPTNVALSSSLEPASSFDDFEGIEIGAGTRFDRDGVLVITDVWRMDIEMTRMKHYRPSCVGL
jgi:hypothetical protein